jgi:formamidopyrimidine-DNA glycosylase
MPELPEVQTIVDDLNKKIIGRRITGAWFDFKKQIKKPPAKDFEKLIKRKKILRIRRRAKNILIYLSDDLLLLIHQKLTGHLLIGKWKVEREKGKEYAIPLEPKEAVTDPQNQYIHLILYLDDGRMLALSDLRKFAKVILGPKGEVENLPDLKELGPEPLDPSFKVNRFISLISSEKQKIKQVLMNQEVIAGIGNIYSDEILWLAKIHPFKAVNKLSEKELKNLYSAMKKILEKALKLRGASISDYRDTAGKEGGYDKVRLVYQREGEKCRRNDGGIIVRKKIGGRSAHFCSICQKL